MLSCFASYTVECFSLVNTGHHSRIKVQIAFIESNFAEEPAVKKNKIIKYTN